MSRTTQLWRGAGSLMLGGVLLSGVSTFGADETPLSNQLSELGRQALAQGARATAQTFFQKALLLDPTNQKAARGLSQIRGSRREVLQVAMQDPPNGTQPAPAQAATPPAVPPADANATLEKQQAAENVARQQLTNEVEQRLQKARELVNDNQPEAALNALRLAQNVIRSATSVSDEDRTKLDRRVQAQLLSTALAEERIVGERAEHQRIEAAAEQRTSALENFQRNKQTIASMMVQFDTLMTEGVYNVLYNGGMGDIRVATAPFTEAKLLAQKANALQRGSPLPYSDNDPSPMAGRFVSTSMGFLSQELQYRELEKYRYLLTLQDVSRAAIPFPDTQTIEYPEAQWWREISEKRIKRWGRAVDLYERDPKTKQILEKLEEPISMGFPNETPLDDVLKYVKQATTTPSFSGIPIYIDPIGLQESEKSLTSTVTIDLEGVPLKTTMHLILKQLGLTYTVKDGYMMITSEVSEDQQTEIRVYPVADLVLIPISLLGGGGMGGGMGGMGGGMGGMGGGMGGMGGGMGGMGGGMGGMGGGMMSIPASDPQDPAVSADTFAQKKSN
jgi:tetratricopeptide (TPR) repeat protein